MGGRISLADPRHGLLWFATSRDISREMSRLHLEPMKSSAQPTPVSYKAKVHITLQPFNSNQRYAHLAGLMHALHLYCFSDDSTAADMLPLC